MPSFICFGTYTHTHVKAEGSCAISSRTTKSDLRSRPRCIGVPCSVDASLLLLVLLLEDGAAAVLGTAANAAARGSRTPPVMRSSRMVVSSLGLAGWLPVVVVRVVWL